MGDNVGDEIFGAANIIQAAGAEPIEPQSFGDSHSVFSSGATSHGDNDISDAMSMISLGSDASKVSSDRNWNFSFAKFNNFSFLDIWRCLQYIYSVPSTSITSTITNNKYRRPKRSSSTSKTKETKNKTGGQVSNILRNHKLKLIFRKAQIIDFLADFDDMSILERVSNRKKKIQDDSEKFLLPDNDVFEQDFDENMWVHRN